jgi:hypothetical protein
MSDKENNKSFGNRVEIVLEGLTHGAFVEFPTTLASVIDLGSRMVNDIPGIWGSDPIVSEPLQYSEDVNRIAQKILDGVNDLGGYYTPPALEDDTDVALYKISEFVGELVIPVGMYTGWGGVVSKMPTISSIMTGSEGLAMAAIATAGKDAVKAVAKSGRIPVAAIATHGVLDGLGVTNWKDKGDEASVDGAVVVEVNELQDNEVSPPQDQIYIDSAQEHERSKTQNIVLQEEFVQNSYDNALEIMVENNGDIDAIDMYGNTALIQAAMTGDIEMAKSLIALGADIDTANEHGHTPLMWASMACDYDMIGLLLDNGANSQITDQNGNTAIMMARIYDGLSENKELAIKLLEKFENRTVLEDSLKGKFNLENTFVEKGYETNNTTIEETVNNREVGFSAVRF